MLWLRCGAVRRRRWQRHPLDPERRPLVLVLREPTACGAFRPGLYKVQYVALWADRERYYQQGLYVTPHGYGLLPLMYAAVERAAGACPRLSCPT
jgi:hypothetical protein